MVDRAVILRVLGESLTPFFIVPLNLNYRDDKNKIKLLALEISSVAAEIFGMGEDDIGQLAPVLDRAVEQMLTEWLEINK